MKEATQSGKRAGIEWDDQAFTFGSIAVVMTYERELRAIFIRCRGAVISTLDPDAGSYYIDTHVPQKSRCRNCGRYGHRDACENRGVLVDDDIVAARRRRQKHVRRPPQPYAEMQ